MTRVFRLVSRFLPVPLLLFSLSVGLTASLHFALFSINHSRFLISLGCKILCFCFTSALLLFFFFPPHVSSVLQHNELQHLQVCSQHLKILNELIERSLSLSVSFSLLFLSLISFRPSLPNFAAPGCRQQWLFFFSLCGYQCPLGANQIE